MKNEQFKPTEEMQICAAFVREVKTCKECLRFATCKDKMQPASNFGALAAKVALCYIPKLRLYFAHIANAWKVEIFLRHATEAQEIKGAVCAIGVQVCAKKTRRVPVYENDDLETLKEKCLRAYVGIWKGFKNGN